MYTRITTTGGRSYLQIVEAYRDDNGKPRQKVVATIGRLDELTDKKVAPLIHGLQRAVGREEKLAKPITYDSAKAFGDLFALTELWSELGFSRAFRRCFRRSRRSIDVEVIIRTLVFNRLANPDSKLGVLRWLEDVAMPQIPDDISHNHLLRAMDTLMDHVEAVEQAVCDQLRPLLDQSLSVVFYDLTTVRVHSDLEIEDDVRAYGRSKEGGIARQFVLGVVQSADGLPLMHTVHQGNASEVSTLKPMLERVLERFAVQRMIVVADRGLLSLDNVDELHKLAIGKERDLDFILAVPARRYGEWADTIIDIDTPDGIGERLWRKDSDDEDSPEYRLIVAYDEKRAREQRKDRRARLDALIEVGDKLGAKLDEQDQGKSARGRKATDRGAYARFSQHLRDAHLTRFIDLDYDADLFAFSENEAAIEKAEALDGKLVLITSVKDMKPKEIVQRYKALADIERGFRVLKSDIEIGPVYHRLPDRIRAHALICFLALVLHRVLRMRLKATGSEHSPKSALAILRRIQQHSVEVNGRRHHGISTITPEQRDLFAELKLPEPQK